MRIGLLDRLFPKGSSVDPAVATALASLGRSETDLRELGDRLLRSGVEPVNIPRALANAELVSWFFRLPNPNRITLDESLVLINWARYGWRR
ncbi:MAG: hypothetical protein LC776_13075 [Acidobacteria bacterium]|nr:hypothetical protein [Acidobacteriota bacterium]